jgi:replicative DNA helicase
VLPATDLEAAVIGVLMQLAPDTARPHLNRLEPRDFTDWRPATVVTVLADMITADIPSIDPSAVFGYIKRTGTVPEVNKLKLLSNWLADAYGFNWPGSALDYHIDLLIEASYRRHVTAFATRISQAERGGALDLLDEQLATGLARLAVHRRRFQPTFAFEDADRTPANEESTTAASKTAPGGTRRTSPGTVTHIRAS